MARLAQLPCYWVVQCFCGIIIISYSCMQLCLWELEEIYLNECHLELINECVCQYWILSLLYNLILKKFRRLCIEKVICCRRSIFQFITELRLVEMKIMRAFDFNVQIVHISYVEGFVRTCSFHLGVSPSDTHSSRNWLSPFTHILTMIIHQSDAIFLPYEMICTF